MTRPLAVAWDIDGTLVDSEPVHLAALIAVSQRYGLDLSKDPEDRFLGQHLGDVWGALAPSYPQYLSEATWLAGILDEYHSRSGDIAIVQTMLDTMTELHTRGVRQVCVSNSERVIVDTNIALLGIKPMILFSISREDSKAGKPDPAPYLEACRRLELAPDTVLAIEDSSAGALSAETAGLVVVRLTPDTLDAAAREILDRFA